MKPFNTLKGIIGEQMEIDGGAEKIYNGGANQYEFGAFKNNWTEYFYLLLDNRIHFLPKDLVDYKMHSV